MYKTTIMKKVFLSLILVSLVSFSFSQEIKKLDASPLDFALFRPNGQNTKPIARIIYSRPSMKNRKIFGSLVPYGKVWRTGANQSTELNLYKDIVIEGEKLKRGNYTLYSIPDKDSWKIIFNSNLFTWGAYDYDSSKNVLEINIPAKNVKKTYDSFGIAFDGEKGNGKLLLAWENSEVLVNFTY